VKLAVHEKPSSSYAWLWLLVAVQVAIPASYYLRDDRDDERFAWRMFSAVRVRNCDVTVREQRTVDFEPVDLDKLLHASWRAALARGRRRVIERFLAKRCHDEPLRAVKFVRTCREVDHEKTPAQRVTLDCHTGAFRFEGMPP
jgi:hypothetical protein